VAKDRGDAAAAIKIKKYANRRLYNTQTSSYVTLEHLCQMVKGGTEFLVEDAKTGEDITRSVLTQIIFEEESKGTNLLPVRFLRQLIRFYGDSLQTLVPGYLEMSMESFSRNQEQMRKYLTDTFGEMFSFRPLEELGRQNMAMLQQAVSLFNPFAQGAGLQVPGRAGEAPANESEELRRLREQMSELRRRIEDLEKQSRIRRMTPHSPDDTVL